MKNTESASGELSTKTVKAVTQVKAATETETRNSLRINYEKAAAEAEAVDREAEIERDTLQDKASVRSRRERNEQW